MLETFASSLEMAQTAAAAVAARLNDGVSARGRASLVATGGRSPGAVYDALQAQPVDWRKVAVTLSDERFTPPASPDSNAGLLQRRLFKGPVAQARFAPLWFDVADAQASALAAEPGVRALAPFDATLLGMGEDGHVASLIPGDPGLAALMDLNDPRMTAATPAGVGSPPLPRITLTLQALLQSKQILVLIAGVAKQEVVARALGGADLPVRAILWQDQVPVRVLWAPDHGG